MTTPINQPVDMPDVDQVFPLFGQAAKAGSLVLDAVSRQVHLSAGMARMHGLGEQPFTLPVITWFALFAPEAQPFLSSLLHGEHETGSSAVAELELLNTTRIHLMIQPHPERAHCLMGMGFQRDCCSHSLRKEQALRKTAELWPKIIDELQIGLWNWNIRTNEVERTHEWNRLLGIQPGEESLISHWEERIHPDDRESCAQALKDYFDGCTSFFETEYRIQSPTGEYLWIADRGKIIEWDEEGEPTRMSGLVMDISTRKNLQQRLHEREVQFRAIFNSMFHFVGLLNTDGTILECNQAVYEFSGLPREYMKGAPIWEGYWWTTDQVRMQLRDWVAQAAAGESVKHEVELVNHAGTRLNVEFSIRPVHDDHGQVIWLVTEGLDITQLKQKDQALEMAEQKLHDYAKGQGKAIALMDLQGLFLSVSEAFTALTGYEEDELRLMSFMDITHPDDMEIDQGFMQGLLEGKCDHYTLEKRCVHRNGEAIPVRLDGYVKRNSAGSALHFIARVTDLRPAWHEQTLRR